MFLFCRCRLALARRICRARASQNLNAPAVFHARLPFQLRGTSSLPRAHALCTTRQRFRKTASLNALSSNIAFGVLRFSPGWTASGFMDLPYSGGSASADLRRWHAAG